MSDIERYMHEAGREIIAKGYDQVIAVNNIASKDDFINNAQEFLCDLDFKLQDPDLRHSQTEWTWREQECMYSIQDGELPGLGIYVFFKDQKAAEECRSTYNRT